MRTRKPRGRRSEQPSLQPLLQSAQGSEKHEDEVDMEDTELLIGFSHEVWKQYDAQRNSTAPPTESEESPEMETDREVAVRSVNPSLQVQDGEERVTSMANSLEVNGDVGMKKQGEEAEELTGLATLAAVALKELKGKSNLCPLLIEESESDSELPSSGDLSEESESESDSELPSCLHPSKAPEDSLLWVLYMQLSGGGITLQELLKCLKKPAEVHNFGGDWKVQVRWHLKTNPYFYEEKGLYYLMVQQPKLNPANIASSSHRYGASSSKPVLSSQHSTPATVQIGLSMDTHEGGGRTKRKAFQEAEKAIATVAMSEQAAELEEMHRSMGDMQMLSFVADRTDSQLVSHGPLVTSSCRKRKSPLPDEEELLYHGHPILLSALQATQAELLVKTEVQMGQRCVVLSDSGKWRCALMAMTDDTLCNHHRRLQVLDNGKTSLSPNSGSPEDLSAFTSSVAPEAGVQTRVQHDHRHKSEDGTTILECCSTIVVEGHTRCEDIHHKQLREERKARQLERADAQQGKEAATHVQHNHDSSIMGLPDLSSLSLHPKSAKISPPISREDTRIQTQAAKNDVDTPATGVSNHDDDSDGEQLQPQKPQNHVPKRRHFAARKSAANVGALKRQGPEIRTPTIPPLPPPYGIRRKTPVKNRDYQ